MIQELALTLVCLGASDTPGVDSARTTVRSGGETVYGTTTLHTRNRSGDRMTVEVRGETVRVRAPATMEPAMAGRGDDGWRELTEVSITDREIRGVLRYNWVNKPVVIIDRMTGQIVVRSESLITGISSFVGDCEPVSTETQRF